MTRPFQLILPLADLDSSSFKSPPPFAALAAECSEEKILSVHYLLADGLEKAMAVYRKTPLTAEQERLADDELAPRLRAFFLAPEKSADFRALPLCYSMLPSCVQDGKLAQNECEKVLEEVRTVPCGKEGIRTYREIGGPNVWDNAQAVASAYSGPKVKNPLAKAAGAVCSVSPFAVVVPCYRVVSAGPRLGELGNNPYVECEVGREHAWEIGREIKRWLLEREGWEVVKPAGSPRRGSEWKLSEWELRRAPVGD